MASVVGINKIFSKKESSLIRRVKTVSSLVGRKVSIRTSFYHTERRNISYTIMGKRLFFKGILENIKVMNFGSGKKLMVLLKDVDMNGKSRDILAEVMI